MALKATIHKAELTVTDLDRDYYATHHLTVALHPSETEARMMLRLLVFALNAHDDLAFTKGISTSDEPDLWRHHPDGTLAHWIELGLPEEKRLRKACGQAERVSVYGYGARQAPVWWDTMAGKVSRFDNLAVTYIHPDSEQALAALARRSMRLQAMIQDDQVWFGSEGPDHLIGLSRWYR